MGAATAGVEETPSSEAASWVRHSSCLSRFRPQRRDGRRRPSPRVHSSVLWSSFWVPPISWGKRRAGAVFMVADAWTPFLDRSDVRQEFARKKSPNRFSSLCKRTGASPSCRECLLNPCLLMLPFRFAHAMRMRRFPSGVLRAPRPAMDHYDIIMIPCKEIAVMAAMMVNRKRRRRRLSRRGQGLVVNLTLGAPPIGRSDSRNRPFAAVQVRTDEWRECANCGRSRRAWRTDQIPLFAAVPSRLRKTKAAPSADIPDAAALQSRAWTSPLFSAPLTRRLNERRFGSAGEDDGALAFSNVSRHHERRASLHLVGEVEGGQAFAA